MSTEHTPSQTGHPSRRNAAIGIGAGLLAGGAIGLLTVAPSLTSAASGDAADSSSIVVAQDDTTDDTAPGTRLRELLQDLVDDGTITATQADAVAEHLIENRPERSDHGRHGRLGGPGRDGEVVAGLLGIDTETLREELRAGNSIADIAEANGVDPQTVIDALVAEAADRITARINGD